MFLFVSFRNNFGLDLRLGTHPLIYFSGGWGNLVFNRHRHGTWDSGLGTQDSDLDLGVDNKDLATSLLFSTVTFSYPINPFNISGSCSQRLVYLKYLYPGLSLKKDPRQIAVLERSNIKSF